MRNALLLVVLLVVSAQVVLAGEKLSPLDHVEALAAYVAEDGADFDGGNDLYKAAKAALAEEAKAIADADARPAAKRYAEIRPEVAEALRRDTLPAMAWIMGVFGASLLWGGMAFCIGVARKRGGGKGSA